AVPPPFPLSLHDALPVSLAADDEARREAYPHRLLCPHTHRLFKRSEVWHGRNVQRERRNLRQAHRLVPDEQVALQPLRHETHHRSEEHTSEFQSRENLVC